MTKKYQRPSGAYAGEALLNNRNKYQLDSASQPKVAISSSKMDGDFNYIIDALNEVDVASGTKASIAERLKVSLNEDGSLKASASTVLDDWINLPVSSLSFVNAQSFALNGDRRNIFKPTSRVRLMVEGSPVFGSVKSSLFNAGITTVTLCDLVNSVEEEVFLSAVPSAVAYSPIFPSKVGNAINRFENLPVQALELSEKFKIVEEAGALSFYRNEGVENAPSWVLYGTLNDAGFSLNESVVTERELAPTGVEAGSYTFTNVSVDETGRIVTAENGTLPEASVTGAGIVQLAEKADMETGESTTLAPSVESFKHHKGVAKAWVNFNGTGTVAIRNSFNVSSITDLGVGRFRLNFTRVMKDTNYVAIGVANHNSGGWSVSPTSLSVTHVDVQIKLKDQDWLDLNQNHVAIFGDYADE